MSKEKFRLEFNEKQQAYHHAYKHQINIPNSHGWITISDGMTDIEFTIFHCFVVATLDKDFELRTDKKNFTTTKELEKCLHKLEMFAFNLLLKNITITNK